MVNQSRCTNDHEDHGMLMAKCCPCAKLFDVCMHLLSSHMQVLQWVLDTNNLHFSSSDFMAYVVCEASVDSSVAVCGGFKAKSVEDS